MISRNIQLLKWFNFFTDFRLFFPIAIIYFSKITGSYALGMSVFGVTQIAAALSEVPTGVFSDFLGRKKTVILGSISSSLAIFFYALGASFWILILGAIFEGLSRSFYSGNNDALLYATLQERDKEEEFHFHFGKLSAMFQIALAISALLGGLIAFYSLSLVFWFSIIPQLICIAIATKLIEPKNFKRQTGNIYPHLGEAFKNIISNSKLRLLSLGDILDYGFGEASFYFRSAFVNSVWPIWAVGIPQAASNLLGFVGFNRAGKVINKFGAKKVLLVGYIVNRIIGILSFGFVTVFSPVLMSTTSLSYGLNETAKNSLMQREFTDKQRATTASLTSLGGSIFFSLVAYLIGFLADRFNPGNALLVIYLLTFVNLWIYWKLFKHKN